MEGMADRHAIRTLWRAARDGLGRLGQFLADPDDSGADTVFQTRPLDPPAIAGPGSSLPGRRRPGRKST